MAGGGQAVGNRGEERRPAISSRAVGEDDGGVALPVHRDADLAGADADAGFSHQGPYRVKPNVALMKTPICSRVTGCAGQ